MSAIECPHCGSYDNKVIKSVLTIRTNVRNRISICMNCSAKIPSEERIILSRFRRMNPSKKVQEEA
jgi:transcriptional regulator NrdR family protein